ncbi:hypothetical protein MHBO_000383 [Bonamia ostreae]|uniref:Mitochondrial ribosomal protein S9 n=1 Tax=Bonamia ostreae TaxID=126728 RepID=A0ABV2AFH8_9EUKA
MLRTLTRYSLKRTAQKALHIKQSIQMRLRSDDAEEQEKKNIEENIKFMHEKVKANGIYTGDEGEKELESESEDDSEIEDDELREGLEEEEIDPFGKLSGNPHVKFGQERIFVRDRYGNVMTHEDFEKRGDENIRHLQVDYPERPDEASPKSAVGTGKRKKAVASASVRKGAGSILINEQQLHQFFPRLTHRAQIAEPLIMTDLVGKIDIECTVRGGGPSGKSGAVATAVAKAIRSQNPEKWPDWVEGQDRDSLSLLATSDPRRKEKKKIGRKRARKGQRYQRR